MTKIQATILTVLSALCLLAALTLVAVSAANRSIERGLQEQQMVINKGQVTQQLGNAIIRDLAGLSVNNSKIRELLSRHGINVNVNN